MMEGLARGIPGDRVTVGVPAAGRAPFAVWGQEWLALRVLPDAIAASRPFWHLDNGFHRPAGGSPHGYYRITYRGMSPVLLRNPEPRPALRVTMRPWRKDGRHVVLALPGETFGRAIGLDVPGWIATIEARLRAATDRPIHVRPKYSATPLAGDQRDAWALVTHSSNVAVDAVLAGIPVFAAPTSPGVDLSWLTRPAPAAACPCPRC
jgi:hypothetical protein